MTMKTLRVLSLLAACSAGVAPAADLCVDGLCVVRAQIGSTHGLMTRYQPVYLTVENRTGQRRVVRGFATGEAEAVQLLKGDEWGPESPRRLSVASNEYRTLDASSDWRLMLIGLKKPLEVGDTILLEMTMQSGRKLVIPVRVI